MSRAGLPHFAVGPIVKGFGRGSKELGIPTANFPFEVVQKLPEEINTGIYCGWASVGGGEVYKMETHIIHEFPKDMYGEELRVAVVGFLRSEANFDSLDDLIAGIKQDIENAKRVLEDPGMAACKTHSFFTDLNPSVPS